MREIIYVNSQTKSNQEDKRPKKQILLPSKLAQN